MKKVALYSFIFTIVIVPQLVLAGGGPAAQNQALVAEQITSTTIENPLESNHSSTESTSNEQASANADDKSSVFTFFLEVSENRAISNGMNALVLLGSVLLVVGAAFFAYKYYRKTKEINTMLGIGSAEADLDETKKTE